MHSNEELPAAPIVFTYEGEDARDLMLEASLDGLSPEDYVRTATRYHRIFRGIVREISTHFPDCDDTLSLSNVRVDAIFGGQTKRFIIGSDGINPWLRAVQIDMEDK